MQPGTHYSIACYKGTKLKWQVTKNSLSSLARFILSSEPHRIHYPANSSVVVTKEYINFPQHNTELDSFGIDNDGMVQQLANQV